MNTIVNFNINNFENGYLHTLGNFINSKSDGGTISKEMSSSRVCEGLNGFEETGLNRFIGRTDGDKFANNEIRRCFLTALKSELGVADGDDDSVLRALERILGKDVLKRGDYGKGRPLTMRRITAVMNKVSEIKANRPEVAPQPMHTEEVRVPPAPNKVQEIVPYEPLSGNKDEIKAKIINILAGGDNKAYGSLVKSGDSTEWKGLAFRAGSRPFDQVRAAGRKDRYHPVDGFSSKNDLRVEANLKEAKGKGRLPGITGESGVSFCRTVSRCIAYRGTESFIYVIDTTKLGPGEHAWDMDSAYDDVGGNDPDKAGNEVNTSAVPKEAVVGWIKLPGHIAALETSAGYSSVTERKINEIINYAMDSDDAIVINPDYRA